MIDVEARKQLTDALEGLLAGRITVEELLFEEFNEIAMVDDGVCEIVTHIGEGFFDSGIESIRPGTLAEDELQEFQRVLLFLKTENEYPNWPERPIDGECCLASLLTLIAFGFGCVVVLESFWLPRISSFVMACFLLIIPIQTLRKTVSRYPVNAKELMHAYRNYWPFRTAEQFQQASQDRQ